MARNIRNYPGDRQRVAVEAGLTVGEYITVGGKPAVMLNDRQADGTATVQFKGIVDQSFALVIAVGDIIYLDVNGGTLSLTNTGAPWGIALEAIASGTVTIAVRMLDLVALQDAADGVVFTIGADVADVVAVGLQFNRGGLPVTEPVVYQAFLTAGADGQVLQAAVTTLAAGTDGTILVENTSNAIWTGISEADGDADIDIGDAGGANTYFMNVILPGGRRVVSTVITFDA